MLTQAQPAPARLAKPLTDNQSLVLRMLYRRARLGATLSMLRKKIQAAKHGLAPRPAYSIAQDTTHALVKRRCVRRHPGNLFVITPHGIEHCELATPSDVPLPIVLKRPLKSAASKKSHHKPQPVTPSLPTWTPPAGSGAYVDVGLPVRRVPALSMWKPDASDPLKCGSCGGAGCTGYDAAGHIIADCDDCFGVGFRIERPGLPCPYVPGSLGRVAWMIRRRQDGLSMWNDHDATLSTQDDARREQAIIAARQSAEATLDDIADIAYEMCLTGNRQRGRGYKEERRRARRIARAIAKRTATVAERGMRHDMIPQAAVALTYGESPVAAILRTRDDLAAIVMTFAARNIPAEFVGVPAELFGASEAHSAGVGN